jgi:hypothetical protein
VLKAIAKAAGFEKHSAPKSDLFRSDFGSPRYLEALKGLPAHGVEFTGVYPLPMISHSPEFPFSLLPAPLELILVNIYSFVLWVRKKIYRRNPWMCNEKFGQAFLLHFRKGSDHITFQTVSVMPETGSI